MEFPQLEDYAELINQHLDGWVKTTGLCFVRATREEVVAEWEVGPGHLQAYGIVHGGVHAGAIESVASVGAALHALPRGQSVVGLENHTSFLRAVRTGRLRCVGRPLSAGRRTQVWEANVTDEAGQLVATGRVRLLCLEPDATLAGDRAEMKSSR
jgi:uncharacterized protein (TIGR00369 family)